MSNPELKPCPFCGGSYIEVKENGQVWTGKRWTEPISISIIHWCDGENDPSRPIERVGRDLAHASEKWNRRAASEKEMAMRNLIERLEEEISGRGE